jgi:choice-of-anchor B domain-containing protein
MNTKRPSPTFLSCLALAVSASTLLAHPDDPKIRDLQPPYPGPGYRKAIDGAGLGANPRGAEQFPAQHIELLSWISLPEFAAYAGASVNNGNDCWGFVSPTDREYAIVGLSAGTAFVEITDPENAQIVGFIDGNDSLWRDIKVHQHYAYSVTEGGGGIQVIDMSNIDGVTDRVVLANTIEADGSMPTSATHNVALNEASGYLYRCGGGSNGLRIYSLANPTAPVYAGEWTDRYVHDCQVLNYTTGPYAGREIAICCTGYNGGGSQTGLDILDVTDKQNIINLYPPRVFWSQPGYSHQVWLSPDRRYAYVDDELDESNFSMNTRAIVIDVQFLLDEAFTAPSVVSSFFANSPAIGHNLYTRGDYIYEANYRSGLRVFCAQNPTAPVEVAYFDTFPANDSANFNGAWSTYPYFPSENVIISDMERGLFVVRVGDLTDLSIAYPQGLPVTSAPDGSTNIRVAIGPQPCGTGKVQANSPTLHYDTGGGFVTVAMQDIGAGEYEAAIAPSSCGDVVNYYVSAQNALGVTFTDPPDAPTSTYSVFSAYDDIATMSDNFETDLGWTTAVVGATGGQWERGAPVPTLGWAYDPDADSDGSGQCYLTQNALGNTDVDSGSVVLTSPTFDFTDAHAHVSYDYFLRMTVPSAGDGLFVQISENGDAGPWTQIAAYTTNGGANWHHVQLEAAQIEGLGVTRTSNMKVRFLASDLPPDTIVEAAIDAFKVSHLDCLVPCLAADGDVNADGSVDGRDIVTFIKGVAGLLGPTEVCHGDFDLDQALTETDVPDLVDALLAQ